MNVNLPIGRRLEMSRPAKISEFGQEEISLAFVGPAAAPCPDPSLARPNPLCIRPLLFNSHDRALVSERHGETARRANPAAKLFGGYMQFGFRSYKLKEVSWYLEEISYRWTLGDDLTLPRLIVF